MPTAWSLGVLASIIANILRGKHKPSYTPHVDCGDHVVIINADKVRFTGKKLTDKIYYKHTGYVGGIKATTPAKILEGRFPERVLEKASSGWSRAARWAATRCARFTSTPAPSIRTAARALKFSMSRR